MKVDMYSDRFMLLQRLVLAHNGEQCLAVHEVHVIHDSPRDGRILVFSMRGEEDDLRSMQRLIHTEALVSRAFRHVSRLHPTMKQKCFRTDPIHHLILPRHTQAARQSTN